MDTFSTRLKQARKTMRDHMRDHEKTAEGGGPIREAETSRRVDTVLCLLCGYDPYTHLNRERRVREHGGVSDSMDFVIVLPPKNEARLIVEVKSISRGLTANMHSQVYKYAHEAKCEWTLLTNGKEWQLLHVDINGSDDVVEIGKWNLLDGKPAELERCFNLISLNSVKKGGLTKLWKAKMPTRPRILAEVLVSERVLNAIRRTLKDRGFSTPEHLDLANALANNLLQAEHGLVAKRAFSRDSKTPGQKAAETRRNNEGGQPAQTETT